MADKLRQSLLFRSFRKTMTEALGEESAAVIWREANEELAALRKQHSRLDKDSRMMVLPAAALYTALHRHTPEQALPLLRAHGTRMGEKTAAVIRWVTHIPGIPTLLWRNMPKLMRAMSDPKHGYSRHIVSETNELVGVNILSCPLHDAAISLGVPEAAQFVCAMDKACMNGFHHIRYTRTTSVAEGAECCDYRLSYDRNKP